MKKAVRFENGNRLILLSVLPFPLAILTTLLFVFTIGRRFPRDIAPGSSLILPGLVLTLTVMLLVIARVRRQWHDPAPRRFSLVLCGVTSLMAWPVWTLGILPSINEIAFGPERISTMRVTALTTSQASKSRRIYYWATLTPADEAAGVAVGRYFVPKETYDAWQTHVGRNVRVVHAVELLGAETVLDYRTRGSDSIAAMAVES